MKISGFTYIRNGLDYGYPFEASIRSLLPLVDELIVVVGDSTDGTREVVEGIESPKIKIVDVVWDTNQRVGGKLFAEQSNIGLQNIASDADWAFHLQADEVLHEQDYQAIKAAFKHASLSDKVEGILFPFYHFWGDFWHIRNTRRTHRYEIRAFKNKGVIKAYKDSQGFRAYESEAAYTNGSAGSIMRVIGVDAAPIYHYSYARNPSLMKKKANYFKRFWHSDAWIKQKTNEQPFNFNEVDRLEPFTGTHPIYMKELIKAKDWDFVYDPSQSNMRLKDRILGWFERISGKRLFEYKNYKRIDL